MAICAFVEQAIATLTGLIVGRGENPHSDNGPREIHSLLHWE
jgi:hypothetical protein